MDIPVASVPKPDQLTILIAEDHQLMLEIMKQLLVKAYPDVQVLETDTLEQLVSFCKTTSPIHLIIMDVILKDGNTLTVFPDIKILSPKTKVLFFTMQPEDIYGRRILHIGADGFLNKVAGVREFTEAINIVLDGKKYVSPELKLTLANEMINNESGSLFDKLSEREFEVMRLLLQGKTLTEISNKMSIQVSTAGTHKTRLFEKLHVHSLMELNKLTMAYNIAF